MLGLSGSSRAVVLLLFGCDGESGSSAAVTSAERMGHAQVRAADDEGTGGAQGGPEAVGEDAPAQDDRPRARIGEVTSRSPAESPETGTDRTAPVQAGRRAPVGNWLVVVTGIDRDAAAAVLSENRFNEPPAEGEKFVMVRLGATYVGEGSEEFWLGIDARVVSPSGVSYDSRFSCGVVPDDLATAGEVFSDGEVEGHLCWRVKAGDAAGLVMFAESVTQLSDGRVFFALP